MTSVQTAPALPQGGAIIPPNLSQAQLQGMLDVRFACASRLNIALSFLKENHC